ncbi:MULTISPECIES: aldehyde dehydrogenase family protein [unclassified Novosphingobium]|uniref:aldehyde dehydrogenase family protein n=1 Tax=unclassified Novosphingobium TaxID=2644732 RepID=UPI00149492D3|nr:MULTISPECIES: aldehyde dehydrogenase family protein [unclassified Novosphingobium]MBB3358426.1 aldehyde dehydrogenase (NAD+) [Novosphingobium sp. BK256]MBB3374787.1 aldehyde dehydrogenase (NAD+) [Novosphingobium sp. BK280]MBB3379524.1 aldehyde dehydrogenase (NAD+) [Novosphingobium sp. BK258]MBB3421219.1 aldehyde dehydrogenase (NAD+) [Novosphingobium sp. BK267]MBB3449208.1 aldehyde dehydrogenase (NAD+) [Novosphingobium sp. BK352]
MTTTAPTAADLADDIRRVFALQQAHQWEAKASSAEVRKAKLARLKAAVEAHADAIIAAVLEDTRKPVGEIRVTEVLNVTGNIQRNIDNLDAWMAPTEVTPSLNPADRAQIIYEARGVCLVLGPWNFPLGLALGPVAAAIAAGNTCIVKLTDLCPATARVAATIIREAFDEKDVALFEGDVSVATSLLDLPFSHIFFTGSPRVGKIVMAAAAKHLTTVTLELGGKSPVIVDDGADIGKVAAQLAAAKQFNGGQACISPDYVFVKEAQKAALVEGFAASVRANLYGDDGQLKKDGIAQVVNQANFDRVKGMFDDAVAKGATVAVGGTFEAEDLTIHPTMLTDVTPQMTILQDEIFAPVIPVMTYESLDQAIGYIEARDKPLALYIYSPDENVVETVLARTSSGGVTVNGVFSHYLENNLPFGGVNTSGMGSYHGYFGFKCFSHERAVYRHQ